MKEASFLHSNLVMPSVTLVAQYYVADRFSPFHQLHLLFQPVFPSTPCRSSEGAIQSRSRNGFSFQRDFFFFFSSSSSSSSFYIDQLSGSQDRQPKNVALVVPQLTLSLRLRCRILSTCFCCGLGARSRKEKLTKKRKKEDWEKRKKCEFGQKCDLDSNLRAIPIAIQDDTGLHACIVVRTRTIERVRTHFCGHVTTTLRCHLTSIKHSCIPI